MKILLVALNARYVHTNLAVRYLREVLRGEGRADWDVQIREFSINDQLEKIAGEIFEEKPDILGFSCYIWNITSILALVRRLRPVMPDVRFVAGGPEVSFDAANILDRYPELDAIVIGEGEITLPNLIKSWVDEAPSDAIQGIVWRLHNGEAAHSGRKQGATGPANYSLCLPNPYGGESDFRGRLVYVESSRGCPNNCAFCLSSTFQGVRYMEPEHLRPVLRQLLAGGASTIKFVDRTFNADKPHAFAILNIFRQEAEKIKGISIPRAHCEMDGDLLDEEWLAYLADYPAGMIQLEIGVQSTYPPTLKAVRRAQRFEDWKHRVRYLQEKCGIPVHLDLIAGLPYEAWEKFRDSFNSVYEAKPNHLQLGFLKVLKGSEIREKSAVYRLKFCPEPPYTILETAHMTHQEMLDLSKLEDILEKYYNSGRFKYVLELILKDEKRAADPFSFYHDFSRYWSCKGWFRQEWSSKALFEKLWDFMLKYPGTYRRFQSNDHDGQLIWKDALRFDYYRDGRPGQLPDYLLREEEAAMTKELIESNQLKEAIRNDPLWRTVIPEIEAMDKRQWARATAVAYFRWEVPSAVETLNTTETGCWYLFVYPGKQTYFYKIDNPITLIEHYLKLYR
ncbi:B12-binding domain-containing radical SAM protein [Dehalobacter sp. DCM]|uniref:B12-binding domain-containing radical SAM protein n=1 Tax=Dehalobacter sp. DCM TaxID=2907827 RepID=UPI0030812541|nr:B12-binding domain-containing radical SAM protein [Dehalobacter sp. DCM]